MDYKQSVYVTNYCELVYKCRQRENDSELLKRIDSIGGVDICGSRFSCDLVDKEWVLSIEEEDSGSAFDVIIPEELTFLFEKRLEFIWLEKLRVVDDEDLDFMRTEIVLEDGAILSTIKVEIDQEIFKLSDSFELELTQLRREITLSDLKLKLTREEMIFRNQLLKATTENFGRSVDH